MRTERLVGRRPTPADEPLFLVFHRDPRVVSWLGGGEQEITEQENREWLDDKLRHWEQNGFGLYALFARDGRLIGRAGIQQVDADVGEVVGDPRAIELMYALAFDAWGQGYASEIARRLIEVARDDLGRTEIIADTVPHNVRSRRVMEALDFSYEREFWHDDHTMVLYRRPLAGPTGRATRGEAGAPHAARGAAPVTPESP